MPNRRASPSDLTAREWGLSQPLGPAANPGGRPAASPTRAILTGRFAPVRSGCSGRLLPHDLPPWRPWRTVHLALVKRPAGTQGVLRLPKRGVGKRTGGWCGRYRRFAKDDKPCPATREALSRAVILQRMVRRVARLVPS